MGECLAIQLKEKNRYDPAMAAVLDRLDLLARRDFQTLMKIAGVDEEDLRDIIKDIRSLEPKPGRIFGGEASAPWCLMCSCGRPRAAVGD